jgi:hypothetical protein
MIQKLFSLFESPLKDASHLPTISDETWNKMSEQKNQPFFKGKYSRGWF